MSNKEFKAAIEKEVFSLQSLVEELLRQNPDNAGDIIIKLSIYSPGDNGTPNNANNFNVSITM